MKKLGVTGGIGAGKSYVCRLLADEYGLPVYDCDREAKRLNNEDPFIRQRLVEMVGPEVYCPDGTLNRSLLAAYIFGHPHHLAAVNQLVHPRVLAHFRRWLSVQHAPLVVMESAILHSSGFDREMDYVLYGDGARWQQSLSGDGPHTEPDGKGLSRLCGDERRHRLAPTAPDGNEWNSEMKTNR